MLRERLLHALCALSYCLALVLGLFPAPLNWRASWLSTLTDYRALALRCQLLDGGAEAAADALPCATATTQERAQIERRIERYLLSKLCTGFATIWLFFISFWRMHPGIELAHTSLLLINFVLSALLLSAMGQVFYVFCQLYRQFAEVNVRLRLAIGQLRALSDSSLDGADAVDQSDMADAVREAHEADAVEPADKADELDETNETNEADAAEEAARRADRVQQLSLHVLRLAALRFDCYRLTERVFRIGQAATAAVMLRLYVTNVRIVHHFLLRFINESFAEDAWTTASIFALMVFFYWDAVLFMSVIDDVLAACNASGQLLRECSETALERPDMQLLRRALDKFALQVQCHRLVYKLCGFFEVNKVTGLRFFLTVFIQVSVLVQFDLKYRQTGSSAQSP